MVPLVSFVDDNLQYINLEAKTHEFINHETKEWNISSVLLRFNLLIHLRFFFLLSLVS